MKIFTTILWFFLSISFAKAACFPVETRIIYQGKTESAHESLCENMSGKILFYVSSSCVDNSCEILKRRKQTIVIKNYRSNYGSPGFKLCSALGGVPQIFEYKMNKAEWKAADRCFFGKDFVEISLLTHEWKKYIDTK